MVSGQFGSVVVGFDGTSGSRRAVTWACREAELRGRRVQLVRAFSAPLEELTRIHLPAESVDLGPLRASAERESDDVVQECVRERPELEITTDVRLGHPATVLHDAAERGEMLVLGSSEHGRLHQVLLGSTANELMRKSPVPPVVVVRGEGDGPRGKVVVGVDGSRASAGAVGFAFDHAARHGADVVAVLAWDELPRDAIPPAGDWKLDWTDITRSCERVMSESLAGWRERYPDVDVHPEVTTTELPTEILLRHAVGADLVVVGRHGRSLVRATVLGSTSHAIAHYAPCPVAVVH
ncbi:universal stress protein [Saccharopolyspora sp. NFXS83]|uniref:universal stress protein n=1 Tax=Saccharopolyspora sp. NFXS83 TaxID=2993560 RepID=UPI00224B5566|nr:universal stress protein [Saccharopolyspora sp. NFXS83]MCX2729402.1 universal stress protein [Saccharopolyspora sp. NFXS83]